eukprot:CAMPEP_0119327790 /NCGR_PEP_ID=MMETSP1333-20130426/71681_1 /TAXON_ID=418940 /ORGANISM="Scyphosphaera apsteinii, Strain RCC1455" /LENGTH=79 /DNA_ID=CAMNT_0007336487 /DNA_START=327 /DNA_END=564 /DNA_ORIENTATION=+
MTQGCTRSSSGLRMGDASARAARISEARIAKDEFPAQAECIACDEAHRSGEESRVEYGASAACKSEVDVTHAGAKEARA